MTMGHDPLPDLPWKTMVRWAAGGALLVVVLVVLHVGHQGGNPLGLVQPGRAGPSAAAFAEDFPQVELPAGTGLDGQQYYAMARDPGHPTAVAELVDRPRYRFQRPVFPLLAWALHPNGGGMGLVYAFFVVGAAGTFLGCLATGALIVTLGGRSWTGALFALLPGTTYALRVSVADSLALALALAALTLVTRGRTGPAVAVGILAILTKEPIALVFAGWWLADRRRSAALLAVVPAAVGAAWMLVLRLTVPAGETLSPPEIRLPPLSGLAEVITERWLHHQELIGLAAVVAALAAGALALQRRRGHPLWWVVAVQMAFSSIMGPDVIGLDFSASRTMQPMLLAALVMLASPRPPATATAPPDRVPALRPRPSARVGAP